MAYLRADQNHGIPVNDQTIRQWNEKIKLGCQKSQKLTNAWDSVKTQIKAHIEAIGDQNYQIVDDTEDREILLRIMGVNCLILFKCFFDYAVIEYIELCSIRVTGEVKGKCFDRIVMKVEHAQAGVNLEHSEFFEEFGKLAINDFQTVHARIIFNRVKSDSAGI